MGGRLVALVAADLSCNLRQMVDRLHWVPTDTGWRQGGRCFTWDEADYRRFPTRLDFQGLDSGFATQTLKQLKLDGQSQKDSVKIVLNAALGGVWREAGAIPFLKLAIYVFAVARR
eukprot:6486743-Amphidinium_carterae.1